MTFWTSSDPEALFPKHDLLGLWCHHSVDFRCTQYCIQFTKADQDVHSFCVTMRLEHNIKQVKVSGTSGPTISARVAVTPGAGVIGSLP